MMMGYVLNNGNNLKPSIIATTSTSPTLVIHVESDDDYTPMQLCGECTSAINLTSFFPFSLTHTLTKVHS